MDNILTVNTDNGKMYGSTHTHFEDQYDTANDLTEMVLNFVKLGAKKVALTGHGSMFAYEDLKETVAKLKKKDKIPQDFEIVPGVEVYYTDKSKHMVLVAKNYEGYKDLCKVISDAQMNSKPTKTSLEENEYITPLVTYENLQSNIRKGNVYATSACVGGVFCYDLALEEHNLEEKIVKEMRKAGNKYAQDRAKFNEDEIEEARAFVEEYALKDKDINFKAPTKAEREKLNKAIKKATEAATKLTDEEALKENANLLNSLVGELKELDAREKRNAEYKLQKNLVADKLKNKKNLIKKYETFLENSSSEPEAVIKARQALEDYKATENERWEEAKREYKRLEDIFGKENFYFELQNHGLSFEEVGFNNIVKLAYEVGNPHFIASNDIHIGDVKGSDTWQSSLLKRKVEKFLRFKSVDADREDDEEYGIKTDDELREVLLKIIKPYTDKDGVVHTPEEIIDGAIGNIKNALIECSVEFPKISIDGINHFPKFCDDEKQMFDDEVEKGVLRRFPNGLPEGYRERLDYEKDIIKSMGYAGYHLIVNDYLAYGKLLGYLRTPEEIEEAPLTIEELNKYIDEKHIPRIGIGIGPGRGSAAGSLACYCLGITDLDPMPYGLLFERFLNPSRKSMPDIDSDFRNDIREKIYEYVRHKYGNDYVSRIGIKNYAYGKNAVGNAQRYLTALEENKMSKDEFSKFSSDMIYAKGQISKRLDYECKIAKNTIENFNDKDTKQVGELLQTLLEKGEFDNDPMQKKIVDLAIKSSGIMSNLSMHACGALISGDPLKEVIPLAWNEKKQKMTTMCLYPQAEALGLLKMDLLPLKNLSVISKVMQAVGDDKLLSRASVMDILNDDKIYSEIYAKGRTKGVFQVESDGMTNMLKNFKPDNFEDVILLIAAYRPGPMQFIDEMIAVKEWEKDKTKPEPKRSINIDNAELKRILAPTYGVPIYQEQVMQICQYLAGYSLAEADNVRKHIAKKHMDDLIAETPKFVEGCMKNGVSEKDASELFNKLIDFGSYCFNKSHAACYAYVSVFTAYQKLYFPKEFYKFTLQNEARESMNDLLDKYMPEMKEFGIRVLPPELGKSKDDFEIEGNNIRIGYGNIKGESYGKVYKPANSLMGLILKNPDISKKTLQDFAKLNLVDKCWNVENPSLEETRVNHKSTIMVEWIEKYADTVKTLATTAIEKRELSSALLNADKDSEEYLGLLASLDVVEKTYDKCFSTIKGAKEEEYRYFEEELKGKSPEKHPDEITEDRRFEKYALGTVLSIRENLADLKQYSTATFETFGNRKSYEEKIIPAYIESFIEKTAKSGKNYYIVNVIDSNGNTEKVTSFNKPTASEGLLKIASKPSDGTYSASYTLKSIAPFENKGMEFKNATVNSNNAYAKDRHILKTPQGYKMYSTNTTPVKEPTPKPTEEPKDVEEKEEDEGRAEI